MPTRTAAREVESAVPAPRGPVGASLEEAARTVGRDARRAAGDSNGIVVAGCRQFDGRTIGIAMRPGSIGGVGRDIMIRIRLLAAAGRGIALGGRRRWIREALTAGPRSRPQAGVSSRSADERKGDMPDFRLGPAGRPPHVKRR